MSESIIPGPLNIRVQLAGWIPLSFAGEGGGAKVYLCAKAEVFQSVEQLMMGRGSVQMPQDPKHIEVIGRAIQRLSNHLVGQKDALAALKIPKGPEHPATFERLKREIAAMKAVSHPALIRLFAAEEKDPPEWFVMEWHPNGNLCSIVGQYKGQVAKTVSAILPVVEALAALHEKGFVHRDIKPSNIFVSDQGQLILGDCGIAFPTEEEGERLTEPSAMLFSRDWIPDWARFTDLPPQSKIDVFMIAKVIYFMVTGGKRILASQVDEPANDITRIFDQIEGMAELQGILLDCITTKEVACKFDNAGNLLVRLEDLLTQLSGKVQGSLLFNFLSTHSSTDLPIPKKYISENPRYSSLNQLLIFLPNKCRTFRARCRLSGFSQPTKFFLHLEIGKRPSIPQQGFPIDAAPGNNDRGNWGQEVIVNFSVPLNRGWHDLNVIVTSESGGAVSGFMLYGE